MVKAQCALNVVLTGVIAYLLNLVWDKHDQNSTRREGVCMEYDTDISYHVDNADPIITSVWCHHGKNKMCQFENLCYRAEQDEFVMFHHKDSIMENVELMDGSLTLDLSSVQGHNTMQTTIVSLPSRFSTKFNRTWCQSRSLVFKPFLPTNLMHLFHDDVLPLYDSLKYLSFPLKKRSFDTFNIQMIVLNDTEEAVSDEIDRFYQLFSLFPIKYKKNIYSLNGLTCFRDVTVGLSTRTVWYDYGFRVPQGPLMNMQVTGQQITSAVSYLTNNLDIGNQTDIVQDFIILLTRRENRRILNEGELTLKIVQKTRLKVINLSLDTHSLTDIIYQIKYSKGIIGMHGSLLILSMFLRPSSFVIELFPYAINPEHYTPYKTLCQIMDFVYMAWTNQKRENSIPHPDWSPEMGGINHLDKSDRKTITAQTEVPQHLCCSDPSWLYHIYQDTVVDTSTVSSLVQSSMKLLENKKSDIQHESELVCPSKIKGVTCHKIPSKIPPEQHQDMYYDLMIKFKPPWTLSDTVTDNQLVMYEILIQDTSLHGQPVFRTKAKTNAVAVQVKGDGVYVVWIRCVIENDCLGPYSDSVFCDNGIA